LVAKPRALGIVGSTVGTAHRLILKPREYAFLYHASSERNTLNRNAFSCCLARSGGRAEEDIRAG
jgi:hypothetical protein